MAFKCVLVTPEQQLLDESIVQAIVPAYDGLIGFLTSRAPMLVKLGVGPLRIDLPGGGKKYFLIEGGIAQMKGELLSILTPSATPASEIDGEAARAEYAEATARRITDQKSFDERQTSLQRARVKQELAAMK